MIIIFGFVILLILVILISLAAQNRISKNIPLIFLIIIIISIPFLYLARSKTEEESFANRNESLDIYYTNVKKEQITDECGDCPGICDYKKVDYKNQITKPLEVIDNPINSRFVQRDFKSVSANVYAGSLNQGSGFNVTLNATSIGKTKNYISSEPGFYILPINNDNLINFSKNPEFTDVLNKVIQLPLTRPGLAKQIIKNLDDIQSDSFIILGTSGSNMNGIINSAPSDLALLTNNYALKLIVQLQTGDSYAAIIYKRDDKNYIEISQTLTPSNSSSGSLMSNVSLLREGVTTEIQTQGQSISKSSYNPSKKYNDLPFVKATWSFIRPADTPINYSLVFTNENNESFIYISSRNDGYALYSDTGRKGPKNQTFLEQNQPQKWVIEPVYNSAFNDIFYIKTFTNPTYYLEVDTSKEEPILKVSFFKSVGSQYWRIIPNPEDTTKYLLQNEKTKLYLGYSTTGGYLYSDNGNVMLSDSNSYFWKFEVSNEIKPNWQPVEEKRFSFQDFTSPDDFPNIMNPRFNLRGYVQGRLINLSSNGRGPWNKYFSPVWNGDWIYYGTVATYGKNRSLEQTAFLKINLNEEGQGVIIDPFLNFRIPVLNAGANILFGNINSGVFRGSMAVFMMLPLPLRYNGAASSYPVKMRYLIVNDQEKIYNLSSANIYNLNSYSTKFDGRLPAINNFLEMTGTMTYIDPSNGIGFPNQ